METRNQKPTTSIAISDLLNNQEQYKETIKEGKTTAQKNLITKPGRVFNDYPALVDEKTFQGFIKEAKSLMDIPQRLIDIVTETEEPEDHELKDIEKTKTNVKDFYNQIIKTACGALLNPKKREIDSTITKTLVSDEKYLKLHPTATILSLIENIVRSIIIEINEQFISDFYAKWNKEDVLHYEALLAALKAYKATESVDKFKTLQPRFTLEDYKQKDLYLQTYFGEKFIKEHTEQFATHEARLAKINLLFARFQMNWGNDNTFFEKYCKKKIDEFYHTDISNSFLKQLSDKKIEEIKQDDYARQIRLRESTRIDSAVELITKFKVGEIDLLDLAKSIAVLTSDIKDYPKPPGLLTGIHSPPTTLQILGNIYNTIKKRLSRQELGTLDEFVIEIQKQKLESVRPQ